MIRHRWDELVAKDWALPRGEWAGVRPSTRRERETIQAGRKDVCTTFVFQGCGYVLRLLVTKDQPQPSLIRRGQIQSNIRRSIKDTAVDAPQPYSSAVFATALALAPSAVVDLDRTRQTMRCGDCHCIMRQNGPIDPDSLQGSFARSEAIKSNFVQRSGTDGR